MLLRPTATTPKDAADAPNNVATTPVSDAAPAVITRRVTPTPLPLPLLCVSIDVTTVVPYVAHPFSLREGNNGMFVLKKSPEILQDEGALNLPFTPQLI
jgi:hypothetical protein